MSGCAPKIFTASNKWFRTTPEFLCASVVVIQCEKRIKPNKTAFAATINSGCFGCFCFLPAATSWILDFRVCGLPETPKRKSNYCFNKKFDRFFSPSLSNRIWLPFNVLGPLYVQSTAIFMATIKHLHGDDESTIKDIFNKQLEFIVWHRMWFHKLFFFPPMI